MPLLRSPRLTNRLTNQPGLTISLNTTRTSSLVVKNERICLCLKDSWFCGVGSSWGWSAGTYPQLTECCNGSLVTSSAKLCRGFLYFLNPTKLFLIYLYPPLPRFLHSIFSFRRPQNTSIRGRVGKFYP